MQGNIANEPLSEKDRGRSVNFSGFRKSYYLDELFGVTTSNPDWSTFTANYEAIPPSQKTILFDTLNSTALQKSFDSLPTNYELEMRVARLKPSGDIGFKYGTLTNSYFFRCTDNQEILIELGGQVSSELDFFSGSTFILAAPYRLYFCNDLSFRNQPLTFTIRQQEGIAAFFVNEQFLYQVDAFTDPAILVGAIQENDNLRVEHFQLAVF